MCGAFSTGYALFFSGLAIIWCFLVYLSWFMFFMPITACSIYVLWVSLGSSMVTHSCATKQPRFDLTFFLRIRKRGAVTPGPLSLYNAMWPVRIFLPQVFVLFTKICENGVSLLIFLCFWRGMPTDIMLADLDITSANAFCCVIIYYF